MPDEDKLADQTTPPTVTRTTRKAPARRVAKKTTPPPVAPSDPTPERASESSQEPATQAEPVSTASTAPVVKKTTRRPRKTASSALTPPAASPVPEGDTSADAGPNEGAADSSDTAASEKSTKPAAKRAKATTKTAAASTTTTTRTRKSSATKKASPAAGTPDESDESADTGSPVVGSVLFQVPETPTPARRTRKKAAAPAATAEESDSSGDVDVPADLPAEDAPEAEGEPRGETTSDTPAEESPDGSGDEDDDDETGSGDTTSRRRRRRGGRRRRKTGDSAESAPDTDTDTDSEPDQNESDQSETGDGETNGEGTGSRRRRRRRRSGDEPGGDSDDDANTTTRVRKTRSAEDQITAVAGSTRLEAKKQRRREGREAGRRRAPIVSEAEFLARRESVDRVMVVRQREDLTQIAVIEDKVLVEHYVARESQTSLIGNVYLGRVQNVLPSMEAAFIDIGKGRNAVLYAGEVNWSALGHKEGQPRKIESVLQSGQSVLVQVTKDPIGHKGARLTSQVSLAGRFLVYVPDGTTSGISRKLPDTERGRLKTLLKEIVPDSAGVIVRTAAEGASEDELTSDVERLKARWEDIEKKSKGSSPQLLYGEPDLTLKVVRDLFTEDFSKLVIEGDDAWDTVNDYVSHVAPDLAERLERHETEPGGGKDVFARFRLDEQISKGLDRKVWLPSGGSLVIDRTEAMTVVDVNTGKFTGSGGNLEETVTKNNLEAAEEIVRQLRLRDIGGIIVVDFIDMVLESNRDLVVRRLVECLGRDRTRHQVAEVTSLGLVQMTRKRIGTGLLEAFSENCEHCQGRGVVIRDTPVEPNRSDDGDGRRGARRGRGRRGSSNGVDDASAGGRVDGRARDAAKDPAPTPSPKDIAAMARPDRGVNVDEEAVDEKSAGAPDPATTQETAPERAPATASDKATAKVAETSPEKDPETASEPGPITGKESDDDSASESGKDADAVEPGAGPLTTPVIEPLADLEPQSAGEPSRPKVVTRTRRRAASRPAGPPVGVAGVLPNDGTVEPGTAEVEPGLTAHATGAAAEAVTDGGADGAAADQVAHVPIKKRGTRKR